MGCRPPVGNPWLCERIFNGIELLKVPQEVNRGTNCEKTQQWCELNLILNSDWLVSPPTLIAALTHFLLTTNKLFPLINYKLPRGRFILAHVPHLDCGLRWWNWWEDVWNWAEVVGVPRSLHPPHGLHTVARSRERPVWEEAARWEGLHWPSCTELTPGLHLHCEQLPNV